MTSREWVAPAPACGQKMHGVLVFLVCVLLGLVAPSPIAVAFSLQGAPLLFADDFASAPLGEAPPGWTIAGNRALQVVADLEAVGGKAVRLLGDPTSASSMKVTLASEDPIIVVEHSVRWVKGSGLNYYLEGYPHKNNVNWFVDDKGRLRCRYTEGGKTEQLTSEHLAPGWNRLRVVADAESDQFYLYLNDMRTPLVGPLPFRTPVDNWAEIRLSFYDRGQREESQLSESYYDDVKVWSARSVQFQHAQEPEHIDTATSTKPISVEYAELATRPVQWWKSKEASDLAARIVRTINAGELTIGLPLGVLTMPDGILPTQLSALAHVYAVSGDARLREAFVKGIDGLIAARYPSGGWPTVYPKFRNWDLHGDMYAGSTWDEIPSLLTEILAGTPPFDTDIISSLDRTLLEETLGRIPPKERIKRFLYSDYASRTRSWWASEEAARIGDNLISWQMPHGGWWEDIAMAVLPYSPENMTRSRSTQGGIERATFDDHGTIDPIRFLAKLYEATGERRFEEAFYRGLDFVLAAQYSSGGWPQSFPDPQGYSKYVTFNDNAMVNILSFIQDVTSERSPFSFVKDAYRIRLKQAFDKGIDHILRAQIEVNGRLTAWAQQHDAFSYEPQQARVFEPIAITAGESVGVVELLQSIPNPSVEVKRAILSALEWFQAVQLADGQWARFYEIGTNRPIFAGRDGIVRYDVSEIDLERQMGYAWFGTWPGNLLAKAHGSDYLDSLYEDLPDHPTVRVRFHSPQEGARVSGVLPLDIALLHASKEQGLQQVVIDLDDEMIYTGKHIPAPKELLIDTEELTEGRHTLTVTTVHQDFGTFRQSATFTVRNIWRLVQEMQPPLESFFGVMDFLRADSRSAGWHYDTDRQDQFFGDPHRLVRGTDASEYLIWKAPRLRSLSLTAYVRPDIAIEEGLELAVSSTGDQWQRIPYQGHYETAAGEWQRVTIGIELDDDVSRKWVRLTLTDAVSKDTLQIGRLVLEGYEAGDSGGE